MEDRRQHRIFIKNKSQNLWRNNFKKQCLEQFRRSRETQVNQRRFGLSLTKENVILYEDEYFIKFIKNEWKSFLLNEGQITGDLNADLAAAAEEELLQELKKESSKCNSRSLEEEAEYILQFEPEYQEGLESLESDMMIIDEHLPNQNFGDSQGLYDTLIYYSDGQCAQDLELILESSSKILSTNKFNKLFPIDSLFQCSRSSLHLTTRFKKRTKSNSIPSLFSGFVWSYNVLLLNKKVP